MDLIELKCKNCGSQLAPEDFSPQLSAVRCHHCNALYAIAPPAPAAGAPAHTGPRPEIPLPKHVTLETRGDALLIVRKWLTGGTYFLLFFCILWNGFMVVWHTIAISQGAWIMSLFGLIHTAVGIGIAYGVLTGFINKTTIKATSASLSITHGPLPWKGNKAIPRASVHQIYCKEITRRGKNGPVVTYNIETLGKDNRRDTLVKGLADAEQALFVEQRIERHLGIQDTHVPGELPR